MLYILQYLAIFAAFALPFMIGGIVHFTKSGEKKKRMICILCLAISVIVFAVVISIAFGQYKIQG